MASEAYGAAKMLHFTITCWLIIQAVIQDLTVPVLNPTGMS